MLKPIIYLRNKLWIEPKWKILRIYTKTLPRSQVEELRDSLYKEKEDCKEPIKHSYLKGKLEIVNLLLDEEETKKVR